MLTTCDVVLDAPMAFSPRSDLEQRFERSYVLNTPPFSPPRRAHSPQTTLYRVPRATLRTPNGARPLHTCSKKCTGMSNILQNNHTPSTPSTCRTSRTSHPSRAARSAHTWLRPPRAPCRLSVSRLADPDPTGRAAVASRGFWFYYIGKFHLSPYSKELL